MRGATGLHRCGSYVSSLLLQGKPLLLVSVLDVYVSLQRGHGRLDDSLRLRRRVRLLGHGEQCKRFGFGCCSEPSRKPASATTRQSIARPSFAEQDECQHVVYSLPTRTILQAASDALSYPSPDP